jgi:hypothetical protein
MQSRQEELFDMLRAAFRGRPQESSAGQTNTGARPAPEPAPEPVVLVGNIVPKSVEVAVHAKEDVHQRDDFDSALAALKKARGK